MRRTAIHEVQGTHLRSPLAGKKVLVRGVVTGTSRKGFFVQDLDGGPDDRSHAVFVFRPKSKPEVGVLAEVRGEVVDFVQDDADRPTTQIHADEVRVLDTKAPVPEPVWIPTELLELPNDRLADRLNALEGMLVGLRAGAVFVAPSNPFGDYVVAPKDLSATWAEHGGIVVDPERPVRWLPSFRIIDYARAPLVNVGAELRSAVVGPLNYRVGAYQIAALGTVRVAPRDVTMTTTRLEPSPEALRVLTLNGFNLDPKIEDPRKVKDPHLDVDDDVGDGRYRRLGGVIARDAGAPEIVALQEMQDDDGAEISDETRARRNYETLIRAVERAGGPKYRWCDIAPDVGADGGQPGGNIRNGFLYDPERVDLVEGSLRRIGEAAPEFEDSRKPLLAEFRHRQTERVLAVINVHLASKRHQHSVFAPENPGFDPRLRVRVAQVVAVRKAALGLVERGLDFYITGDFNDFEFSETLRALCADDFVNLVERVPRRRRYDYNHRGQLQALMHGIVRRDHAEACPLDYEVLHGNELTGSQPGRLGDKATDHAYVIARIVLR